MESASPERRRFSRIDFDAQATIDQGGQRYPVQLLDISIKGVLVSCERQEQIDSRPASLQIALADGSEIAMEIALIHQHEHYLGFRCTSIDLESAGHLRRLVELNLNIPDAAERVLEELLSPAKDS